MIRRLAAFARPFAAPLALSTALRVVQLALGIGVLAVAVHAVALADRAGGGRARRASPGPWG
ncbi:hypothetical protein [Thermocatellispora tengchongensis]|uniref:hypothetical protein n=1 Tax=Thermocatellispora tengchongensis TaxID=1073253 RepID=UPI003631B397